jgi:hypothetical protein
LRERERGDANPGLPIEGINVQLFRNQGTNRRGLDWPMQEKKVSQVCCITREPGGRPLIVRRSTPVLVFIVRREPFSNTCCLDSPNLQALNRTR